MTEALSDRERQVLRLLADGHTVRAIARKLDVDERTIGRRRAGALAKLGARSSAQAVAIAYRTGILGDGPLADMLRHWGEAGYQVALIQIRS